MKQKRKPSKNAIPSHSTIAASKIVKIINNYI